MDTLEEDNLDISVIICAHAEERWSQLVDAIASVLQQTRLPREIIVVIDHNETLLALARAALSKITITSSKEARGLSGARNHGIALARSALIAFLDDDAVAEPDWLERLSLLCQNAHVLGAGGAAEPLWSSNRPAWFPEEFLWVVGCRYRGLPQMLAVVRNPYGGCMCFRREIFETVGGFRNGLGHIGSRPLGGEETELCIRIQQRWPARRFLYDPQAIIHHHVPARRAGWRYFCARCYAEGCSKALITRYIGPKAGLATEKTYLCSTLPRGILHNIADTFLRRDVTGLLRTIAIITGFLLTLCGYLLTLSFQTCTLWRGTGQKTQSALAPLPAHNYHGTKSG